ncbi:hypothetical protein [Nocardia sp. NPDC005745]|uniref:hypothetical protein n=1 Tax=Actinomycetes TaxID=1760 RepID=UPI0033FA4F6C
MDRLDDWTAVDVRLVTNGEGQLALVDMHGYVLVQPVNVADPDGFARVYEWLRGYLLDA